MESKKWERVWWLCLVVIGVGTIVLAGSNILGIALPDMVIRIVGVVDLLALCVFAFTSVKRFQEKKND